MDSGVDEMKDFRPQVLIGVVVLGALGWVAMTFGYDTIAGVAIGGIVSAVTSLSKNGTV